MTIVEPPAHTDEFIHAQKGLFTYVENAELLVQHSLRQGINWLTLDNLFEQSLHPDRLRRVTVPFSEADRVEFLLDREGISRACLQPTFDHVAGTVMDRWKYQSRSSDRGGESVDATGNTAKRDPVKQKAKRRKRG